MTNSVPTMDFPEFFRSLNLVEDLNLNKVRHSTQLKYKYKSNSLYNVMWKTLYDDFFKNIEESKKSSKKTSRYVKDKGYVKCNTKVGSFLVKRMKTKNGDPTRRKIRQKIYARYNKKISYEYPERLFFKYTSNKLKTISITAMLGIESTTFLVTPSSGTAIVNKKEVQKAFMEFIQRFDGCYFNPSSKFELRMDLFDYSMKATEKYIRFSREKLQHSFHRLKNWSKLLSKIFDVDIDKGNSKSQIRKGTEYKTMQVYNVPETEYLPSHYWKIYLPPNYRSIQGKGKAKKGKKYNPLDIPESEFGYHPKLEVRLTSVPDSSDVEKVEQKVETMMNLFCILLELNSDDFVDFEWLNIKHQHFLTERDYHEWNHFLKSLKDNKNLEPINVIKSFIEDEKLGKIQEQKQVSKNLGSLNEEVNINQEQRKLTSKVMRLVSNPITSYIFEHLQKFHIITSDDLKKRFEINPRSISYYFNKLKDMGFLKLSGAESVTLYEYEFGDKTFVLGKYYTPENAIKYAPYDIQYYKSLDPYYYDEIKLKRTVIINKKKYSLTKEARLLFMKSGYVSNMIENRRLATEVVNHLLQNNTEEEVEERLTHSSTEFTELRSRRSFLTSMRRWINRLVQEYDSIHELPSEAKQIIQTHRLQTLFESKLEQQIEVQI